ncbi:hypothetical protein [Deinococcus misasensis]|uniref:hypothetical protein n=1 Tax=Deinococcus misasensis TaxID=392413 RepID=UPI000550F4CE|nr:hypothetical protein [Deinococcus misasensis]
MSFKVMVKCLNRRVLLCTATEFDDACSKALAWWCKQAGAPDTTNLKGTWLESQANGHRIWFFVPEVATLDAMGWTLPGCEIQQVA